MRQGLSFGQIADQIDGISKSTLNNNAGVLTAEAAVVDADHDTGSRGAK